MEKLKVLLSSASVAKRLVLMYKWLVLLSSALCRGVVLMYSPALGVGWGWE